MVRVEFFADAELYSALQSAAQQRSMSVEDFARLALAQAVAATSEQPPKTNYSFIGIGHSGRGDLSRQADENLKQANCREGWSLP